MSAPVVVDTFESYRGGVALLLRRLTELGRMRSILPPNDTWDEAVASQLHLGLRGVADLSLLPTSATFVHSAGNIRNCWDVLCNISCGQN